MKARFLFNVPNARLLRNATDICNGIEAEYIIEQVIYLGKRDFIPFRSHLLEYNPNISKYKDKMFIDKKGVWHVLMFCSVCSDIMLFVNSEGYDYARYVAIINNGGDKVEPRFTTSHRYAKK